MLTIIHAGGYEVEVKEVTASAGGRFSGEGGAIVPYLMGAKVHVTFKDISVNEQLSLTAREIKTVWNANSPFLQTIEKKVESGKNAPQVGVVDVTVATADEVINITGTTIATVSQNSDGNIVAYTTDGNTKELPKGKSMPLPIRQAMVM